MESFQQLYAWQEAHKLSIQVYSVTKKFPPSERFGVTGQLRRSIISVEGNIAEGFGRYNFRDKNRFYYQARASLIEGIDYILLATDLSFIDRMIGNELIKQAEKVNALINGLISSVKIENKYRNEISPPAVDALHHYGTREYRE